MTGLITPQQIQPSATINAVKNADNPVETSLPLANLPNLSREDENKLVEQVRRLFLRARDERRPMIQKWERNYKILHTPVNISGRADWRPNPNVPEIWPIIDALVSWTTDQQPSVDAAPLVSPMNPYYGQLSEMAEVLKTCVRSTWHVDKFDAEIEKVVWDAMTYHIGYFKTTWDGSAYRGVGNAVTRRVDPWTMYPDPDATSMETSNHFFEVRNMSLQEMERRWPGSIKRINTNAFTEDIDVSPNVLGKNAPRMPMANPGAMSPGTSPQYGLPGQDGRVNVTDSPGVTVIEAWLRTPAKNEKGTWYDSWRCVVVAANCVLLDEMAEDLWGHGQHPYDRYVCIESGEFYGHSMVEKLAPMQRSINRILTSIESNVDLIGNPVMLEESRAGLARSVQSNKPGERLQVNAGGKVEWMNPPDMYPGMATELVKFYIEQMERVSGLSAVVRGASPTGRNAQGVIDSVEEAAFVRIRKSLRNLSYSISGFGEKLVSLITEFYTEPRMVSLIGNDGSKIVKYLQANHFYLPADSGPIPMRFQLLIDSGESASQSRGTRIAEADALFALGAIDQEALLEIHSFPNWQKVVQRVRELQAQQGTLGQPPTQRAAARR